MPRLIDNYERQIDYLRISITDRCNLRCTYCMPEEGITPLRHEDVLRFEEIVRLVRVGAGLGIRHLRLTGGEPLVRKGVVDLVRMLRQVPGIESISMTTNGVALAPVAHALHEAGLGRVNVSLDTLQPERYAAITRRGRLEDALSGIEAALSVGLTPVKINMVVVKGVNDDEAVDFARMSLHQPWHVRFIEFMPLGEHAEQARRAYVSSDETRGRIEADLGPPRACRYCCARPGPHLARARRRRHHRVHQRPQRAFLPVMQSSAAHLGRQTGALPVQRSRV
jgi:GTP 3',8-cyclase